MVEIIDAQVHRPRLLRDVEGLSGDDAAVIALEACLLAMDAVGVDAAVIHSDAAYCELGASRYPDRFRGIVDFHPGSDDVDATVARIAALPGILGFRLILSYPYDGRSIRVLQDGGCEAWFRAAERHDIPVVLFVWGHLPEVAKIASTHPGLRLVVDHFGGPPVPHVPFAEDRFAYLPELLTLARFPNVAVKVTGLTALSNAAGFPFADLREPFLAALGAFGAERLFWGSDFTRLMTGTGPSWRHPVRTYAEAVASMLYNNDVSGDDREQLLGAALRKWYRWPAPVPSTTNAREASRGN